ncbi:hypothetical protein [Oryzobacter telluris]|uniref:hypothetical protein n=1 Tax=Oryzobacter telluris TaxID=3149179 RepID=UPI00370D0BBC
MQTRDTLDRATSDHREAAHLRALLHALRDDLEEARGAAETARRRHGLEEDDVKRLEGVRLSALLAAVRGTRTGELHQERAQEVAARYALETATRAVEALEEQRVALDERLARLGDTAARKESAAQAHAEAVRTSGSATSPALERVLDELATVRAEAVEVDEALAAGRRALASLEAAQGDLGSADSWSAYDTWFGGGLISSSIKHDRIDRAAARIQEAQRAVADFTRELADTGPTERLQAHLGITPMTRTLDVWFDNIFTDLSVRSRIKDSAARVDEAARAVREAVARLTARADALRQGATGLREERDALLGDAP